MSSTPSTVTTSPVSTPTTNSSARDISIKWVLLSLIILMIILNIIFAITYGYLTHRRRRRHTHTQCSECHETRTITTEHHVTVITRDRMIEIEDDFDPWTYWATDSETDLAHPSSGGGMRRAGDTAASSATRVGAENGTTDGVSGNGVKMTPDIATSTKATTERTWETPQKPPQARLSTIDTLTGTPGAFEANSDASPVSENPAQRLCGKNGISWS